MKTKKNIDELLEALRKDSGFRIPFGYFDTLSPRISDRISSSHQELSWQKRWILLPRQVMAYSLLVVGIVLIGYIGYDLIYGHLPGAGLTEAQITEYISYQDGSFLDFELEELMMEVDEETWYDADEEVEEIINYLDLQEVDLHTLINEF